MKGSGREGVRRGQGMGSWKNTKTNEWRTNEIRNKN